MSEKMCTEMSEKMSTEMGEEMCTDMGTEMCTEIETLQIEAGRDGAGRGSKGQEIAALVYGAEV